VARPNQSKKITLTNIHFANRAVLIILRYEKTIYIFGFDGGADFCGTDAWTNDEKGDASDAKNCGRLDRGYKAYGHD
jgi:hypothetical protein